MKKILVIAMTVLMCFGTLVGCSTGNVVNEVVLQDLVNQMVENEYVAMPKEVNDTLAADIYHINLDNVVQYGIADTGRSPGIGLIVIAQAKDGKVEEVKANMEQLLKDKVGNAFYPDEVEAAQRAQINVDGPYVSLFILHPDVEAAAIQMYQDAIVK